MRKLVLALCTAAYALGCGGAADPTGGGSEASDDQSTSGGTGIQYHGGPLMLGTPNVYFIWYGQWGHDSALSLLPTLIGDLSGSSYEQINTTYYDSSKRSVSGLMTFSGQVADTDSQGLSLSDAGVESIVSGHAGHDLPVDSNGIYILLAAENVTETAGFCSDYCGRHGHSSISGQDLKYIFVGYSGQCPAKCEAQAVGPNGNPVADSMASIVTHETEETISDPDLDAWYDLKGLENADKCAWTFGTESTAANGAKYNFIGASGTQWMIQQNWVNRGTGGCSMSL